MRTSAGGLRGQSKLELWEAGLGNWPHICSFAGLADAGLACGCCVLGGSDEFCGVLFIRFSGPAIFASTSRMMARASGGWRAISSFVI
jgi:hypothetical protein